MRKIIDIKKNNKFIINTPNFFLKLLDKSHVSKKYLSWLNDKKTSEFTYRIGKKFNLKDINNHIKEHKESKNTLLLGIFKNNNHIGNLLAKKLYKYQYPKFLLKNKNIYEISTLVDKRYWQKGVTKETTIYLANFIFKNFKTNIIIFCCFENHFASIIKSISIGGTISGSKKVYKNKNHKKTLFIKLTRNNFYKKNKIFYNGFIQK
mgnify:CR=1 FL=1|tara:strand:- start:524 stop:1141 length:618 start_codon:yes stop_codon:yes gene_type:complete